MCFPPGALGKLSVSKTQTLEIIAMSVQSRKYKLASVLNPSLWTYLLSILSYNKGRDRTSFPGCCMDKYMKDHEASQLLSYMNAIQIIETDPGLLCHATLCKP